MKYFFVYYFRYKEKNFGNLKNRNFWTKKLNILYFFGFLKIILIKKIKKFFEFRLKFDRNQLR